MEEQNHPIAFVLHHIRSLILLQLICYESFDQLLLDIIQHDSVQRFLVPRDGTYVFNLKGF